MSDSIKEILKYIQLGCRIDLKVVALENILSLTGNDDGLKLIIDVPQLLVGLLSLLEDPNISVAKDASLCLVNISASEKGSEVLINLDTTNQCLPLQKPPPNVVHLVLKHIFNENSNIADPCCMILSNLTRPSYLIEKVIELIQSSGRTFDEIIEIFTKNQYNKKGANLHYLGPVLSNLSQNHTVRKYILDKEKYVIQRLLPFTQYEESIVRRGGVVGTLKNCCFESDFHEWLLSEKVDILPRLLLPLAANEEFDEEDNDKLPLELQYLPEDKQRESDPDIRCMLLEAITQLCDKRCNREFIRDKNTYIILRELHKWEQDKKAMVACENLVDILIRTEDEIGYDKLKELEISDDIQEKLNKFNEAIEQE